MILCVPLTKKKNQLWIWITHPSNHPSYHPHHHPYFQMSYGPGSIACASLSTTANNPTLSPSYQFTFVCFIEAMYGITLVWAAQISLILAILYPIPFLSLWVRMRVGCMLLPGGDYLNHNSLPNAVERDTSWEPRQVGSGL